jgi:hypothetical protein
MRNGWFNPAEGRPAPGRLLVGSWSAHGRTSLLVANQLPVPLGDDVDGIVDHFYGGLIVD